MFTLADDAVHGSWFTETWGPYHSKGRVHCAMKACKEGTWLPNLVGDLGIHAKSKHIKIHNHFLQRMTDDQAHEGALSLPTV